MGQIFFDMEAQRFSARRSTDRPGILFDDANQIIRTEHWSDDGYITFSSEEIENKKEYFKRKLKGK